MAIKQIFKSRMPNINYVLRNGKAVTFGEDCKFMTEHAAEISELQKEVDNAHQHIYRDPEEMQIDTTLQDKIREAQQKATLEIMEQHKQAEEAKKQAGAQNGSQGQGADSKGNQVQQTGMNSGGMSAAQLLNVTSSAQLGALAAGSASGSVASIGTPSK